ncbi:MAG: hypothetical protein P8X42_04170 [Calditrichaceae bacterium]
MKRKRTYRTKEIKFKVALEAIREQKQISEIAEEYDAAKRVYFGCVMKYRTLGGNYSNYSWTIGRLKTVR